MIHSPHAKHSTPSCITGVYPCTPNCITKVYHCIPSASPWVPQHPKHITLFITSSQLHHPGCHGNLTTSLWVPAHGSAHSTLPKALRGFPCFPSPCWGREDSLAGPGQQMGQPQPCCLFSLCLTAALWILLLPRLWTEGPAQETQPNIYLPLFDLKQLGKGCKSVHQHPANPTFPPARESQH